VHAIATRDLTKRFGDRTALDRVRFEVAIGEFVALLGDNGAGKSTLVRTVAGMVVPDEGEASVMGLDSVRDRPAVAQRIGTMLDSQHTWYPRLSGRANLEFFGVAIGLDRRSARTAALEGLASVRLGGRAEDPVAAYSSGMRARLALARARLADPPILLLDEPTAILDRRSAEELAAMLEAERGRRTVVAATHDPELASWLGARPVVLEQGRIQEPVPDAEPLRLGARRR
jgi:ABC-2 type transport system ATP-binding protein